ncbi:DUF4244 domain-containing protein [Dactylosporangium sp. CA-092794]|uniref:DUF4244 domain-containing protein n=1 Tax=Dactylosporangium sp. CA-092794 TaxID=3239929 RepID=UPI003D8AA821
MYVKKSRRWPVHRREQGSISVEYAMVMVVAVVLAGILLAIVSSDAMRAHLTALVMRSIG